MTGADCDVAVVGAGIAGLACAVELLERGADVRVVEAAERAGGPVESVRIGELLVERGPSTVRATPELEALAARASVPLVEARRAAPYLVANGRLVALPPSPAALLSGELLPLRALASLLGEPFRPRGASPRTVVEFVRERFGADIAARFADVLTLGVYGTSADRIGFEAAFPALAESVARHGSLARAGVARLFRPRRERAPRRRIISTPHGLAALPAALAARLGDRLELAAPLVGLRRREGGFDLSLGGARARELRARRVVLAIPPARAASLVDDDECARLLSAYESTPQTLAAFAIHEAACRERWSGFGFLVPSRERLPLLGALFPTALFPERAPASTLLVTVFAGPALAQASDAGIAKEIMPVLRRLLGAQREPQLLDVARHREGIVRYDPEHPARTCRLRERLRALGGPLLAGYGYDGVAFGAAAASGLAAARELSGEGPAPAPR